MSFLPLTTRVGARTRANVVLVVAQVALLFDPLHRPAVGPSDVRLDRNTVAVVHQCILDAESVVGQRAYQCDHALAREVVLDHRLQRCGLISVVRPALPMSTSLPTRSGRSTALTPIAVAPPIELPTRLALRRPSARGNPIKCEVRAACE